MTKKKAIAATGTGAGAASKAAQNNGARTTAAAKPKAKPEAETKSKAKAAAAAKPAKPATPAAAAAKAARAAASARAAEVAQLTKAVRRASVLIKQVSDPTRLQILLILAREANSIGGISGEMKGQSQPAISHHLTLLRHGRLISTHREGRGYVYTLTEQGRELAETVARLV